jgi:signal transduction histidine kinase
LHADTLLNMRTDSDSTPAKRRGAQSAALSSRVWMPVFVIALTLGVLVTTILLMMGQLHERLRAGIVDGDSMVLEAATAAQSDLSDGSAQSRLLALVTASNIRDNDIFGVRLFDENGKFLIAVSKDLSRRDLKPEALARLRTGKPFGLFVPHMEVSEQFMPGTVNTKLVAPVLIATVPIKANDGKLTGAAEFLLNGARIEGQLREVDREVRASAFWFSVGGGALILVVLLWAFHRLNHANRLLADRTANLLRANHELTMAAKTSALGAVAAHLIHGLKNPLFGIQAIASMRAEDEGGADWKAAADSARRMQMMIADVVRIMREESGNNAYEVSISELAGILHSKVAPLAREASVKLVADIRADGALPNREANLVILVATNLVQNAVQASKAGAEVCLAIFDVKDLVMFEVTDHAGGLPESTLANLFTPCQSSKAGGTGLGLAISKQLANHMGGQLELLKTGPGGTTFRLSIPRQLFLGANLEAANAVA